MKENNKEWKEAQSSEKAENQQFQDAQEELLGEN